MEDTYRWLRRQTAADYLDITVSTLDRWADQGKITKHRLELDGIMSTRYDKLELDRLVQPSA